MTRRIRSIAGEAKAQVEVLPAARRTTREALSALRMQLRDVDARTRGLIQERPLTAVAAALALGFVLRRLLPSGR